MQTKKQIRFFTIFQYEQEQDYLRQMHRAGWKLTRVTGLGMYHFEQCPPQDVIYQLDYNKDGLAHKEEYLQMFADCGWQYIQDYVGYSYFRKPAGEDGAEEEIFCDEESKFQMMQRVIKGRMIPLLVIFFCVLLPQLINTLNQRRFVTATFLGVMLALYLAIFVTCAIQYLRYKERRK